MPVVTWPSTLPDCFVSYSEQMVPTAIRSEVDVGLAKIRRRYTKAITDIVFKFICTREQVIALYDFYKISLQGGTQSFTRPRDLITNQQETYRFLDTPSVDGVGGGYFNVTIRVERL